MKYIDISQTSSHKYYHFPFIRQFLFWSADHKKRNSSRIFIRTFIFLCINDISRASSDSYTYMYADNTSNFFTNIWTLQKLKIVEEKNLQMYANSFLLMNYQFILVKIKLSIFFSVENKLTIRI